MKQLTDDQIMDHLKKNANLGIKEFQQIVNNEKTFRAIVRQDLPDFSEAEIDRIMDIIKTICERQTAEDAYNRAMGIL